jgi:hypothetical protein
LLRIFILFLLFGCAEETVEIYETDCPEMSTYGEHIGYLSIDNLSEKGFLYWGCMDGDCVSDYSVYGMRVDWLEGNVLRVCCGVDSRVDKVNVVVIK